MAASANEHALGRLYQPGEDIIRQGEVGECMLVIQEGQVALLREQDGEEIFLGGAQRGRDSGRDGAL